MKLGYLYAFLFEHLSVTNDIVQGVKSTYQAIRSGTGLAKDNEVIRHGASQSEYKTRSAARTLAWSDFILLSK